MKLQNDEIPQLCCRSCVNDRTTEGERACHQGTTDDYLDTVAQSGSEKRCLRALHLSFSYRFSGRFYRHSIMLPICTGREGAAVPIVLWSNQFLFVPHGAGHNVIYAQSYSIINDLGLGDQVRTARCGGCCGFIARQTSACACVTSFLPWRDLRLLTGAYRKNVILLTKWGSGRNVNLRWICVRPWVEKWKQQRKMDAKMREAVWNAAMIMGINCYFRVPGIDGSKRGTGGLRK